MSGLRNVPLFGRGFKAQTPLASAQKLVNMYREPSPDGEKGSFYLACTPGLTLFANVSTFVSRGSVVIKDATGADNTYSVHDSTLFKINSSGGVTSVGTINTGGTGLVSFAWNGTQLMFVDGTDGWIFLPTSGTLTRITDVDFPSSPKTVTFLASRFIVNKGNTGQFHWSALLDGATWAALDFATAESETDNLVAVESDHGSLVLIGDVTTEFWAPDRTAATSAQAFVRVGGAGIEWGCAAVRTLCKLDTGLAWLAKNRLGECRLGQLQGYQFVPFDGPEESRAINAEATLSASTAFSYAIGGHSFYQLNAGANSYLYDALTRSWSYVSSGVLGARHTGDVRAAFSEKVYVFGYADGKLYLLDKNNLTDNEATIVREVTTRHLFNASNRVSLWALQVECEVGKATGTTAPQVMLQVSKDGGQTWGNELWKDLGAIGQFARRVIWHRLGQARDLVFRIRVTDKIRVLITSASAVVQAE